MKDLRSTYKISKDTKAKAFLFRHIQPGKSGFSVPFKLAETEEQAWAILERQFNLEDKRKQYSGINISQRKRIRR